MGRSKFNPGKERDWSRPNARLPTFWSFSRFSLWEGCPLRYAFRYIYKLEEPDNRAMVRGQEIHSKSEHYLLGDIKGIPDELRTFREEFAAIRKLNTLPEISYTVTKTWQPTFPTDWDNAWLRGKIDIEIVEEEEPLTIIDVKSGKEYPDHESQADIYGLLGLIFHPAVPRIDFEYWYVDSGDVGRYAFERAELRGLKAKWKKKVAPMLNAKRFVATPSTDACRFCSFRSDKKLKSGEDGPCRAWKEV